MFVKMHTKSLINTINLTALICRIAFIISIFVNATMVFNNVKKSSKLITYASVLLYGIRSVFLEILNKKQKK